MKTPKEAAKEGYKPLTNPYGKSPEQAEMMRRALTSLRNVDHCLVAVDCEEYPEGGVEIWRKGIVATDESIKGFSYVVKK